MNTTSSLFEKHDNIVNSALTALHTRSYFTPYPENPKAYSEDGDSKGKNFISSVMNGLEKKFHLIYS